MPQPRRFPCPRPALPLAAVLTAAALAPASAGPADEAVLAACRANAEVLAVPRAAELGCACAVDAMVGLSDEEKQTIAAAGFTPESFGAVADSHPDVLAAVRGCLAPDQN
ncbi:MAG: hypothetical protein R3F55_10250 [Alphaproteobacteria bacterium]